MKAVKNRVKPIPIQIILTFYFFIILSVSCGFIVTYLYIHSTKIVLEGSDKLIKQIESNIIADTAEYLMPALKITNKIKFMIDKGSSRKEITNLMTAELISYDQYAMIYIGYENGDNILMRKGEEDKINMRIIDKEKNIQYETEETYYREILNQKSTKDIIYDPRKRVWYKGAKEKRSVFWTDIYTFFTDKQAGITFAEPLLNKKNELVGVIGIDIYVKTLSEKLKKYSLGPNSIVMIINNEGNIISYPNYKKIMKKQKVKISDLNIKDLKEKWILTSYQKYKKIKKESIRINVEGKYYKSFFSKFPKDLRTDWTVVTIIQEDNFIGEIKKSNRITVLSSLIIVILGSILASLIAKQVAKPIKKLTEETNQIKDFILTEEQKINSLISEVNLMSNAIQSMKNGLKSFEHYVPSGLVRQLIKTGKEAQLESEKCEITIMFTDIANFTSKAEEIEAEKIMIHLSKYLNKLTKTIKSNDGTIDKYIGDAIMALWGVPERNKDQAKMACKAALECAKEVEKLNKSWLKEKKPDFPTRFGIHSGKAVVGNVGSSDRMNYTAIGDNVNLASRIESINKMYGTIILITEKTKINLDEDFLTAPIDIVAVKGKKNGVKVFELIAYKNKNKELNEYRNNVKKGFDLYLNKKWSEAEKFYRKMKLKYKHKKIFELYYKRVKEMINEPPNEDWNGIYIAKNK